MEKESIFCEQHQSNGCAYKIYCKTSSVFEPIIRCQKNFFSQEEMIYNVYATIVAQYYVVDSILYKRQMIDWDIYHEYYRELFRGPSQEEIMPMTNHRNRTSPTNHGPAEFLRPLVHKITRAYLLKYKNIDIDTIKPGTLMAQCLKQISFEDIIYERLHDLKQVVFTGNPLLVPGTSLTTANLRLYRDFSPDTSARGYGFIRCTKLLKTAVPMLMKAYETQRYYGKIKFSYSPRAILKHFKLGTSGGIFNGKRGSGVLFGSKCEIRNSGLKIFQIESKMQQIHSMIHGWISGIKSTFQPLYRVTKKQHILLVSDKMKGLFDREKILNALQDAQLKGREFFIPSMCIAILSSLFPRVFERGAVNCIGIKWWHGGAQRFAEQMHYDNPQVFWVDGDISNLDKSITDWQLLVYFSTYLVYTDFKSMNQCQRRLFFKIFKKYVYHNINKVVLHEDDIWEFIKGKMASGCYDTSNGDTFVTALYFYLYVSYIMEQYVTMAPYILQAIEMKLIRIKAFGDDHIWSCLKVFRHIMNAKSYAQFLDRILNIKLRDFKEYDSFLSIVDKKNGVVIKEGPKFLKTYFILSEDENLAKVVPFRPSTEPIIKALVDLTPYPEKFILKSIGLAWNSYGTNYATYSAAKLMYDTLMCGNVRSPYELYLVAIKDRDSAISITKTVRQIGISAEKLYDHFPDWEELVRRNIMDDHKNKFGYAADWLQYFYFDDRNRVHFMSEEVEDLE